LRLQAVEEVRCPLRVGGCRENGAFVLLQDFQPVPEIGGVIVADFRRNAEVGAKESGSKLRYQFLAGITVVAETLRVEAAVKTALVVRPMGLMPISA
jgi:hypothetical protein